MLRVMRTATALATAALAAACQDPRVDVAITVPDAPRDYAAALATVTVRVLAPADDAVDCDRLAFGEESADAIELAQVTATTLRLGEARAGAELAGVPRTGRKLFLVEGRDADGPIVAGCAEHGEITDDVTVTVATEPVVTIDVDAPAAEAPVPAGLRVRLDDGFDDPAPIAGREVRWTVYGAGGEELVGPEATYVTGAGGAVDVALATPAGYGPASIQLRARWARSQPLALPAFESAGGAAIGVNPTCTGDADDTLEVDTDGWQPLRLADGRAALVGLARDAGRSHLFVAAWNGEAAIAGCSDDLGDVGTFAILRATPDTPVDRVLVMSAQQWIEYELDAGAGGVDVTERRRTPWTETPPANRPGALVTVRDCAGGDPADDYVLAQFGDGTIVPLVAGEITPKPFAAALNASLDTLDPQVPVPKLARAGCIAQDDDEPALPALILELPRGEASSALTTRFVVVDQPGTHFAGIAVPSFGAVAFTPVSVGAPLLLGGAFDPSGARVVRWRLTPGDDGPELREVASDDAAGAPSSIAIDDLDGDGALDTVWGLVDAIPGGLEEARLQIALGCGAGGLPLNSLSPAILGSAAAVFIVREADGSSAVAIGSSRAAILVDPDAR